MKTQVVLHGANCPVCLQTVRKLLLRDPRVEDVVMSFGDQCLEVEHRGMPDGDLLRVLRDNLHGITVADNGEQVMAEVLPTVGEWHCHAADG